MNLSEQDTFVGFGFGAIQAGLYLFEAQEATRYSSAFDRLVVAYRRPEVIARVRDAKGYVSLNIARQEGTETVKVGPIEMFDVNVAAEREYIIQAVAEASEIAVAVSSVDDYIGNGPESLHRLLARGLKRKAAEGGRRAVIYASENDTQAAQQLESAVLDALPGNERQVVHQQNAHRQSCFVNTVIGKMSRTVHGLEEIERLSLEPMTPDSDRAFLVESYSHILVSKISFPEGHSFERGLTSFSEKDDLTPFEDAKLYGHNATHALAAYLGTCLGVTYVAELTDVPGFLPFLRAAALEESGAALLRKHQNADPMFTPQGYADFMDGLLKRMLNPNLKDTVARVGRDVPRKLGWDDRLVGAVRLALSENVYPLRFALGIAAALGVAETKLGTLPDLWKGDDVNEAEKRAVLSVIERGVEDFNMWQKAGCPALEPFVQTHLLKGGRREIRNLAG